MPRLDLVRLKVAAGTGDLYETLGAMLNACTPDDPPYMSDLIIKDQDGGLLVRIALEERYKREISLPLNRKFHWHLKVLRDEWGNQVGPGDVVKKRQQRSLYKEPGKIATTIELEEDLRAGDYDNKWVDFIEYPIDEKGCITCEFPDTVYFLLQFGIHGKSMRPISRHVKEKYTDFEAYEKRPEIGMRPIEAPDGNKLHPWYWRYMEVDKAEYEALPILEPVKGKKRGIDKV